MTADTTTDLGHMLAMECQKVEDVENTILLLKAARDLTPAEVQDVARVKAALARRDHR